MAATGFLPSRNGLRFRNAFPPRPVLSLRLIGLPRVGIGSARGGLCGGMVFAALDYYWADVPVPPDVGAPQAEPDSICSTPLFAELPICRGGPPIPAIHGPSVR